MESVANTTSESGDTDSLAVGHAGLYKVEEFAEELNSTKGPQLDESKEILADIELGLKDGGKTLITCEKGIKTFVKDELAKGENHLPNSELGVWIHYLTEGIKKDFGRTWNETPKSLRPKRLATPKILKSGKTTTKLHNKRKTFFTKSLFTHTLSNIHHFHPNNNILISFHIRSLHNFENLPLLVPGM